MRGEYRDIPSLGEIAVSRHGLNLTRFDCIIYGNTDVTIKIVFIHYFHICLSSLNTHIQIFDIIWKNSNAEYYYCICVLELLDLYTTRL